MTPDQASDLAARTLDAIDVHDRRPIRADSLVCAADRERVASDLAGLRYATDLRMSRLTDLFSNNLRRTAALYGVTL